MNVYFALILVCGLLTVKAAQPYFDKTGFVDSISSPDANSVWNTGSKYRVTWECLNTKPSWYPTKGMSVALFLGRKKIEGTETTVTQYQVGTNEVELNIPKFSLKNSSSNYYVRFWYGRWVYAESPQFTVNNLEQGEYKWRAKEEGIHRYVSSMTMPKAGDRFVKNSTVHIQFQTDFPIPPGKELKLCVTRERRWLKDDWCTERILVRGPYSGSVDVYWIIPEYLVASDNYVIQIYDGSLKTFESGKFAITDIPVQIVRVGVPAVKNTPVVNVTVTMPIAK